MKPTKHEGHAGCLSPSEAEVGIQSAVSDMHGTGVERVVFRKFSGVHESLSTSHYGKFQRNLTTDKQVLGKSTALI